jgi:hypothetical protein
MFAFGELFYFSGVATLTLVGGYYGCYSVSIMLESAWVIRTCCMADCAADPTLGVFTELPLFNASWCDRFVAGNA